jgi:hypothetical protein
VAKVFRALTDVNAEGHAIRRPQTLERLTAVIGRDESLPRQVLAIAP